MLIDWFTVGAQAINFIILVWLLKRFLYRPVLDAIDAREKGIAAELADAAGKKADAERDRIALRQKNDTFDRQRAALLARATDDANAERAKLMDAARGAADALSATRRQTMDSDARSLNAALRRRTQDEVFSVARQALSDLATASLEASACDLFIARLRALEGTARDELVQALNASNDGALVRSAFDLPTVQRAAVRNAIDETFSTKVELRYETAPDLVGGIELTAHGQKFAWSIRDYLASLERGVDDLSKAAAPSGPPAAKPVPPTEKAVPSAEKRVQPSHVAPTTSPSTAVSTTSAAPAASAAAASAVPAATPAAAPSPPVPTQVRPVPVPQVGNP